MGVTGTLGSKKCWKTLSEIYKTDIIFIPDSHKKKMNEYPSIEANNEK
jgi:hypothetical protein